MEAALDELALPHVVVEALADLRTKRDALQRDDSRRVTTEQFLSDCLQRISKPDPGSRPRMPAKWSNFVGNGQSDPRRASREDAYTAMQSLLFAVWPTMSNVEKQARKRQKQQQHDASSGNAGWQLNEAEQVSRGACLPSLYAARDARFCFSAILASRMTRLHVPCYFRRLPVHPLHAGMHRVLATFKVQSITPTHTHAHTLHGTNAWPPAPLSLLACGRDDAGGERRG